MSKECVITEIRKSEDWWYFKFGQGDDFMQKVDRLKVAFDWPSERGYLEENKEWAIIATDESEDKLAEIFPNGREAVQAVKAQLSLF